MLYTLLSVIQIAFGTLSNFRRQILILSKQESITTLYYFTNTVFILLLELTNELLTGLFYKKR